MRGPRKKRAGVKRADKVPYQSGRQEKIFVTWPKFRHFSATKFAPIKKVLNFLAPIKGQMIDIMYCTRPSNALQRQKFIIKWYSNGNQMVIVNFCVIESNRNDQTVIKVIERIEK